MCYTAEPELQNGMGSESTKKVLKQAGDRTVDRLNASPFRNSKSNLIMSVLKLTKRSHHKKRGPGRPHIRDKGGRPRGC
jgi:hypothetical protein